jgi:hypothetical protein
LNVGAEAGLTLYDDDDDDEDDDDDDDNDKDDIDRLTIFHKKKQNL